MLNFKSPGGSGDDALSSKTLSPDLMDRGHLDGEKNESQVLRKSFSYNSDMCPEPTNNICQDYPLSSQTPTPDFVNRGHLDWENDIYQS